MTTHADAALLALLTLLDRRGYDFVTPTPATHARVVARPEKAHASTVRDMLGWSLPFVAGLDPEVETLLTAADMLELAGVGRWRSRIRVSRLHDMLFLHSAYPTNAVDAVFFGPDSYRFANLVAGELRTAPAPAGARIVDFGAGAGVGGLVAARSTPGAQVVLVDANAGALRFARINAEAAGLPVETIVADSLDPVPGAFDLVVINPPFMADTQSRGYRDGGGRHGGDVPFAMTQMAAARLAGGGRVIVYTGAAIVEGRNALCAATEASARGARLSFACHELDPDIFGEELDQPAYGDVERIALVAMTLAHG